MSSRTRHTRSTQQQTESDTTETEVDTSAETEAEAAAPTLDTVPPRRNQVRSVRRSHVEVRGTVVEREAGAPARMAEGFDDIVGRGHHFGAPSWRTKEASRGYSPVTRALHIECAPMELPVAVREPTERSVTKYLWDRLRHDVCRGVRDFLDSSSNSRVLKREAAVMINDALKQTSISARRAEVKRRILETFCGRPSSRYSVEKWFGLITYMIADMEDGARWILSREYLEEHDPGPYWQLNAIYVLSKLIDLHPRSRHALFQISKRQSRCCVCLETLEEKGAESLWYQFEPCRDWVCADCEAQLEQHGVDKFCPLCRSEVAIVVSMTAW